MQTELTAVPRITAPVRAETSNTAAANEEPLGSGFGPEADPGRGCERLGNAREFAGAHDQPAPLLDAVDAAFGDVAPPVREAAAWREAWPDTRSAESASSSDC